MADTTVSWYTTEKMGHICGHLTRESALDRANAFPGKIVAYEVTTTKRLISQPLDTPEETTEESP